MTIERVTVAGGGTLGAQSALQFALNKKDVTVFGRSEESIERAKRRLEVFAGKYSEDTEFGQKEIGAASAAIRFTSDPGEAFSDCDLIFECTSESIPTKREVLSLIEKYSEGTEAIIATNSSTFLPSKLSEFLDDGSRFLAVHLANEIWKRNTAEIMPHPGTVPEVSEKVAQFVTEVGLVPIPLHKEHPGYLLNSLLVPWLRAGLDLAAKGVAEPQNVDLVWERVMGSEGPFRAIDIIGLRTTAAILSLEVEAGIPGSKEIVEYIKTNYLDKGRFGVENGKGFYDYV